MRLVKLYLFAVMLFISLPLFSNAQDNTINSVLTNYFVVKNDLTTDNYALAKTHSVDLATAIKTVPMDKVPADQAAIWKKIQLSATRLGAAKDIDLQRDYFAILSQNMIVITKALKTNTIPVYQQYCPMKKLSWLSELALIKNPYYGKQMLTCGQTVETLAAANK